MMKTYSSSFYHAYTYWHDDMSTFMIVVLFLLHILSYLLSK